MLYTMYIKYGVQGNTWYELHVSSPVYPTGAVHGLQHVEVTPDIDLGAMKYKGSLIFGSVYMHNIISNNMVF